MFCKMSTQASIRARILAVLPRGIRSLLSSQCPSAPEARGGREWPGGWLGAAVVPRAEGCKSLQAARDFCMGEEVQRQDITHAIRAPGLHPLLQAQAQLRERRVLWFGHGVLLPSVPQMRLRRPVGLVALGGGVHLQQLRLPGWPCPGKQPTLGRRLGEALGGQRKIAGVEFDADEGTAECQTGDTRTS